MMKQFLQDVQIRLQERLGSDYEVRSQLVMKNNNVEKRGLVILHKEENVSPTIYMEYYFQEFKNGVAIEELVTDIITAYRHNAISEKVDIVKFFEHTDTFGLKLISKSSNGELLKIVPYQTVVDDYVVIPLLVLQEEKFGNATITVRHELMNMIVRYYNFDSVEEFFEIARANEEAKGFTVNCMEDVLENLMSGVDLEKEMYERDVDCNMYVISNRSMIFGAVALCFTELLDEVARKFYSNEMIILPSSVHELICIEGTEDDMAVLKRIVIDINKELAEEDVLSSMVIHYNANTREFKTL